MLSYLHRDSYSLPLDGKETNDDLYKRDHASELYLMRCHY